MTLQEKIEEVSQAYKVLEPFVKEAEYKAYLLGLIDARFIEIIWETKEKDI